MERRFLVMLWAVTAALVAATTSPAAAEEPPAEPTWWERCEELPSDQVERCFLEHNGESERGERPPTEPSAPLDAYIGRRYPAARNVFTNCPRNNTLGERKIVCEYRLILRHRVLKGTAAVEAEDDDIYRSAWWMVGFNRQPSAPIGWHRCRPRRNSLPGGQFPVSLRAHGVSCQEASELGGFIGYRVSQTTLRLPRRFAEGGRGTNTLGHVVRRYRCRGWVRVRQGNPNPYGRETAVCWTRFGDRLVYVFDQHS